MSYVILVIAFPTHTVCASVPAPDVKLTVFNGSTVIVPVTGTSGQPPVVVMLYVNGDPNVVVGVPLIVKVGAV
ncbi:MAG: hypothetical protein KatS3mg035_0813 [Bacteroidia bacterium]|nr:MAG: hypothetical protein KatS3mg035_0813 [Bacteroidia bacterium]